MKKDGFKLLIFIEFIIIFLLVIISFIFSQKNIEKIQVDKELLRSQDYQIIEENDANVDGTNNVKFTSYFLRDINEDGTEEKLNGTCKKIGKTDNLYIKLDVLDGTLKNGKITINSNNFSLITSIVKDEFVKENVFSIDAKEINLNDITGEKSEELVGEVVSGDYNYQEQKISSLKNNINNYSKINSIILTGTYVTEGGESIEIEKTVDLTVDWYGEVNLDVPNYLGSNPNLIQIKDASNIVDEENNLVRFTFDVAIRETQNELLLQNAYIEGNMPRINGYSPVNMEIQGENIEYTYDVNTRKYQAEKNAEVDGEGYIIQNAYDNLDNDKNKYNVFTFNVTYPLKAYTLDSSDIIELKIPVRAYYKGFNNPNDEFENPFKSAPINTTLSITYKNNPEGSSNFGLTIGKCVADNTYMVSKKEPLMMYNNISSKNEDLYTVRWYSSIAEETKPSKIIMKDARDSFIKTNLDEISIDEISSFYGIYFSNSEKLLGPNGTIKVYDDDTNDLIVTFGKSEWNNYSVDNPYIYASPIKHIRVVTSEVIENDSLYVYNVKTVDDRKLVESYSLDEFNEFNKIKSSFSVYSDSEMLGTYSNTANYNEPYSYAEISIDNNSLRAGRIEENIRLNINAFADENYNQVKWINGSFLVKLPSEIENIRINSVISNNPSVNIGVYDYYKENDNYYLKIVTQNSTGEVFDIKIDCDIEVSEDASSSNNLEFYFANDNTENFSYENKVIDVYDVNGNTSVEDIIGKQSIVLNFTTNEGNINENLPVENNDTYSLDLLVLQKYRDYTVSGATYSVVEVFDDGTFSNYGKILVTNEDGKSTINGLIVDKKYALKEVKTNKDYVLNENIIIFKVTKLGGELNFERISGDIRERSIDSAENKVSLTVEDDVKVKLKLKIQDEYGNPINNSEWKLYDINYTEETILITNENGEATASGLTKNLEYFLSGIKADGYYSDTYVRFSVNSADIDIKYGAVKSSEIIRENGIPIANLTLELKTVPKYNLEITKVKKDDTSVILPGARFRLYHNGTPKGEYTTDENGKILIENLNKYVPDKMVQQLYTLREIVAPEGYARAKSISFKVSENDEGDLVYSEDGFVSQKRDYTVDGNTVKITIENSPAFKLKKTDGETAEVLPNIKFAIYNVDDGEVPAKDNKGEIIGKEEIIDGKKYYVVKTNENGEIVANLPEGLYKAVEVEAPEKYDIDKVYYFGVGTSRQSNVNAKIDLAYGIACPDVRNEFKTVEATKDGGYAVAGYIGGTVKIGDEEITTEKQSGFYRTYPILIRYDKKDQIKWLSCIKSNDGEYLDIKITSDGGIIAVGVWFSSIEIDGITYTSSDFGISYSNGSFIVKYDADGNIQWHRVFLARGIFEEHSWYYSLPYFSNIAQLNDGSYALCGVIRGTWEIDGQTVSSITDNDSALITHITSDGLVDKNIVFGGMPGGGMSGEGIAHGIEVTPDGGFVIGLLLSTHDDDCRVIGNYEFENPNDGFADKETNWDKSCIIKFNQNFKIEWYQYNVAIYVYNSFGVYENGDIIVALYGGSKVAKYNKYGELLFEKNYYQHAHTFQGIIALEDGGFIIGASFEGTITLGNKTYSDMNVEDAIFFRCSEDGEVLWSESVSGYSRELDHYEIINDATLTKDNKVIFVGYSQSRLIEVNGEQLYEKQRDGIPRALFIRLNQNNMPNISVKKAENSGNGALLDNIDENSYVITSENHTHDGGKIVGGYYKGTININDEEYTSNGNCDSLIIKYSKDNNVEWIYTYGESGNDGITEIYENEDTSITVKGTYNSSELNIGNFTLLKEEESQGYTLRIVPEFGIREIQELNVKNELKTFDVEANVKEIVGIRGGNISGQKHILEEVKYGEDFTKELKIVPDENYELVNIRVNGEEYEFETEADGSYTMPIFENVKNDINIEVEFGLISNIVTINKKDNITGEGLKGAEFKIDQIDTREIPDNDEIIGDLVTEEENKDCIDVINEVTDTVLGNMINSGSYYFVKNEEGYLIPTNGKTYQLANGGTEGIGNSVANSYFPIDLRNLTGNFIIQIKASTKSQSNNDIGFATINTRRTNPVYSSSSGRFMYESGDVKPKNYESDTIAGGKMYYLHLGYRKNASVDYLDDQIVIQSIRVFPYINKTLKIEENNGVYESNSAGVNSSNVNGYIPIDLTSGSKNYYLDLTASISSEEGCDIGYVIINDNTNTINYKNNNEEKLVEISGDVSNRPYRTLLEGGKMYYMHIGYYKDGTNFEGTDTFKVSNINLSLDDSYCYHTLAKTNKDGKIVTELPYGTFRITEINAPEGYYINQDETIFEFTETGPREITITDEKEGKVIVHHYIKGTTEKVSEDEILKGNSGTKYTTSPKINLKDFEIEQLENGEYALPENVTGNFKNEDTKVVYNYIYKDFEESSSITKSSSINKITENNKDEIDYKIEYSGRISKYIGDANIKIVDELPYEIDEANSDIDGATYDAENRTLTWTLDNSNIDTYLNGDLEIDKEINISLVYKNFEAERRTLENKVYSKTSLKDNYEDTKEFTLSIPQEIKGKVIVKYLDKDTDEELETEKEYVGIAGDEINISADILDIEGYVLKESPANTTITYTEQTQQITLYYEKRNDLKYTVNYLLKDEDNDDTNNEKLEESKTVDDAKFKEIINAEDEEVDIPGYKVVGYNKYRLVIGTDETENILNIYYEIDDGSTKVINYKVEYYKDNELVEEDTQIYQKVVQVLEPDELEVDEIDKEKYEGYNFIKTDPEEIPEKIENDSTIKVYFEIRKDLVYTVNYLLKDEDADDTNNVKLHESKVVDKQTYDEIINAEDEAIEILGYKVANYSNNRIHLKVEGNSINIYYEIDENQTKELKYTVEYYKDNVLVEEDTQIHQKVVQVLEPDELEVSEVDIEKYEGYSFIKTDPEEIPEKIENDSTIKVYYEIRKDIKYTVNYLLLDEDVDDTNNVKLHESKVVDKQTYDEIINAEDEAIEILGYKVSGYNSEVIKLKVTGNVINIYYEIDEDQTKELKYTVEYYLDNILDDTEIETLTVQVLEPDELEVSEIDKEKYEGYEFIGTNPKKIPEKIESGSTIKVYYESLKDNIIDKSEEAKEIKKSKEDNYTINETIKANIDTRANTKETIVNNNTIINNYIINNTDEDKTVNLKVEKGSDVKTGDINIEKIVIIIAIVVFINLIQDIYFLKKSRKNNI